MSSSSAPTDLITYLRFNSVSLIAHPVGADRSKVAAVLCSKTRLPDQKCLIITHDFSSASESLRTVETPLVDILDYTKHDEILTCRNRLICFDNFMVAKSILSPSEFVYLSTVQNNILLFLYTYGIRESDINYIDKIFPDVHMWKATFTDQGENLPIDTHHVAMTERQDLRYSVEMERCREIVDFDLPTCREAEKYCNIVYPLESTLGRAQKLLAEFGHGKILDQAPKIRELFIVLGLNIDQRHLIYTTFNNEYGMVIVEAIARLFKYNVFVISNRINADEKLAILSTINSSDRPCVIITNTTFRKCETITNLTHLHFLDGDINMVPFFVESFYKYSSYTITPSLATHIYVADRHDGTASIETMKYIQLRELLVHLSMWWEKLNSQSVSIVTNREGRLAIMV